jgi:ribulose-phosphate 3-epimerase
MTVDAGFAGRQFAWQVVPKIRQARKPAWEDGLRLGIEVDGSIDQRTVPTVVEAGANTLVSGSSCGLFRDLRCAPDIVEEVCASAAAHVPEGPCWNRAQEA